MSSKQLSIRISAALMEQLSIIASESQTNLTMTVTRLLSAGQSAEAVTALLGSQLELAQSEIARLKAASSLICSAATERKSDAAGPATVARDGVAVPAVPQAANRRSSSTALVRDVAVGWHGDRYDRAEAQRMAKIADRQGWVLRGVAIGVAVQMAIAIPMPYDWWYPQLIAQAAMGGRGLDPGARLVGYDSGVEMLTRVCPIFENRKAEHEAGLEKAEARERRRKQHRKLAEPARHSDNPSADKRRG